MTVQARTRAAAESLLRSLGVALICSSASLATADDATPNLSGYYDTATITPLQRDPRFGNNLILTREQAEALEEEVARQHEEGDAASDPNRGAPPAGGDGSDGAAGNVGGYNAFWIDAGDTVSEVDGTLRTSIITDPENGRMPGHNPAHLAWLGARYEEFRAGNTGEAWWLDRGDGSGPYDDPELRPHGERCLLGFGSTGTPPMLPVLYNNLKRIVQTEDTIMILAEMVHDTRIIRLDSQHLPSHMRRWLGDSIGHFEGQTLVVDTTNFIAGAGIRGSGEALHVVERFTPMEDGSLHYAFTVEDSTVWQAPWSGEYVWPRTEDKVFEYACHEGNYALGNVIRGARLAEAEKRGEPPPQFDTDGAGVH